MAVTLPSYPNDLDEFTNEFTGAKYYYDNGRIAWIFNGEGGATGGGEGPDPAPGEFIPGSPVYMSSLPPQSLNERRYYKLWLDEATYILYAHVFEEAEDGTIVTDLYASLNSNGHFRYVSNVAEEPPLQPEVGHVLGALNGQTWFNSKNLTLYIRANDQWIALNKNEYDASFNDGSVSLTKMSTEKLTNINLRQKINNLKEQITYKFGHVWPVEEVVEEAVPEEIVPAPYSYTGTVPDYLNTNTSITEYRSGV